MRCWFFRAGPRLLPPSRSWLVTLFVDGAKHAPVDLIWSNENLTGPLGEQEQHRFDDRELGHLPQGGLASLQRREQRHGHEQECDAEQQVAVDRQEPPRRDNGLVITEDQTSASPQQPHLPIGKVGFVLQGEQLLTAAPAGVEAETFGEDMLIVDRRPVRG
jgi:hypothetical protein